jgi:MbtH protein
MPSAWDDEDRTFIVLVNEKGEYSLWPSFKEIPLGWKDTGQKGSKQECMDYVDKVWTTLRPMPRQ